MELGVQHIVSDDDPEKSSQPSTETIQNRVLSEHGEIRSGSEQPEKLEKGKEAETLEASTSERGRSQDGSNAPDALTLTDQHGDVITPVKPSSDDNGPVCMITLLLPTGSRHPYKIDHKYLARRNVDVPGVTAEGKPDPLSISVYTLKELILREWRSEWDSKPASPTSIRLIFFGKLLEDKEPLQSKFR